MTEQAFFAEYFDTRDADKVVEDLNNRHLVNITLRLTHRQPPSVLDLSPLALDHTASIADLQRQRDEIALFNHYRQIVEAKQREEEQSAAALAVRTPDSVDIARGGPFDASVGTLGRRGSFPGSSPRIDEREERFASLVDPSGTVTNTAETLVDFERERKGSNHYGADQSKAVIPRYPSPRTPTRTTSQQSLLTTPKKKHSLPLYSGALPPPDMSGNMAWPLLQPLRLPTQLLSAGLTNDSGSIASSKTLPSSSFQL
jgi:hypothetical protein